MLQRNVPYVNQGEATDCGYACLAMLWRYYGETVTVAELKSSYGSSTNGMSLYELHQVCTDQGFSARGIKFDPADIGQVATPAILHWSGNHYVVLQSVSDDKVTIVDPAFGRTTLSRMQAGKYMTGYALELLSAPEQRAHESDRPVEGRPNLMGLITGNRQIWPLLGTVGLAAVTFQLLSLTMPYLVSLVIDKAVVPRDLEMLSLILYAFGGFFVAKIAIMFVKIRLQANLHHALTTSLFSALTRHLLSLSYPFFLKRSSADIHTRIRTLDAVRVFFSTGVFEVPFGLLYSFVAVGILLYLDATIAMVAIVFIIGTLLLEIPAQMYLEARQSNQIQTDIEESKAFVSSMLRIDHIKLNSSESAELADLNELQLERQNAERHLEVARDDVSAIVESIRLIEKLVLVFLLASKAIEGALSIGLAVAFLMFADEIKNRLLTMVKVWSAYRSTRVHLDRLEEISLEPPEFETGAVNIGTRDSNAIAPQIDLDRVSFQYSRFSDPVVRNVTVSIKPGDKVVFHGPSGSGKSTLLRILSSLLPSDQGEFLVDGHPCEGNHKARYRQSVGGMFAEDRLSEGTILTNLLKDIPDWKESELDKVLTVTGLDQDLARMESGLNSLIVGDGRGVSSGQAQRILLARALLQAPPVLLLDEPTSHCNGHLVESIVQYLAKYEGTVIVCTHHDEFLQYFDHAYRVVSGTIEDLEEAVV